MASGRPNRIKDLLLMSLPGVTSRESLACKQENSHALDTIQDRKYPLPITSSDIV